MPPLTGHGEFSTSRNRPNGRGSIKTAGPMPQKRTPLEEAIAQQTDKRARYDARQREKGFVKTSLWVRKEYLLDLKVYVALLNRDGAA